MGGEKSGAWWIIILFLGSPPHRRGKEYDDPTQNELIGITPAWAGKSRRTVFAVFRPEDHPRMGGEKARWYPIKYGGQGSPPRGRGKAGENHLVAQLPGITPAWAGKSCPGPIVRFAGWDHPRVGGEKRATTSTMPATLGSPPHRRGKDKAEHLVQNHIGITPAQAGKRGS